MSDIDANEQDLLDIQYKRRVIYDAILQGDITALDPAMLTLALRAMSDIDKTVKNIRDSKQSETDADTAEAHNELLAKLLLLHKTAVIAPVERELIELPDIELTIVPGELD